MLFVKYIKHKTSCECQNLFIPQFPVHDKMHENIWRVNSENTYEFIKAFRHFSSTKSI